MARENELREKQIALEGRFDQAEADIRKKQLDEQAAFEKALTAERNKAMADLRQDLEDCREKFDISLKEKESLWEESFRKRENEEIEKAQTRVSEILRQAEKDAALRVAFLLKNAEEKDAQAQERLNRIEIKENELHQKEINLQNEEEQLEADRQKHEREDRRQRLRAENLEAREADLDATISEGISDRIEAYEKRLRDKDDSLAEISPGGLCGECGWQPAHRLLPSQRQAHAASSCRLSCKVCGYAAWRIGLPAPLAHANACSHTAQPMAENCHGSFPDSP